jgi:four helix bundle protein
VTDLANVTNLANGQRTQPIVGAEFRRQLLWQKAQAFAVSLTKVIPKRPQNREADVLAAQLLRSGSSIAVNVAEGYGRYSQAAYRNHLSIARGSAFETESWLDLLEKSGYLTPATIQPLIEQCTELQKLLTLRMKSQSAGKTYATKRTSPGEEAI